MSKRMIVPIVFGLVGMAILVSLGLWQARRLVWKQDLLAEIEARMLAEPIPLTDISNPSAAQFIAVTATGSFLAHEVHILASTRDVGAVYRIIAVFETDQGQRILVDRGYILSRDKYDVTQSLPTQATIIGNIRTPDEVDDYTPPPDLEKNIWFARDLPEMARVLQTEEVLVILRQTSEANPAITPLPLDRAGIPNNHLNYVITWFLLALGWLGMTGYWLWRIRRQTV